MPHHGATFSRLLGDAHEKCWCACFSHHCRALHVHVRFHGWVYSHFRGCRVLAIQSQSKDADVQKRVLQTMVMVVTWKSCDMTEDTVAQVISHFYKPRCVRDPKLAPQVAPRIQPHTIEPNSSQRS